MSHPAEAADEIAKISAGVEDAMLAVAELSGSFRHAGQNEKNLAVHALFSVLPGLAEARTALRDAHGQFAEGRVRLTLIE